MGLMERLAYESSLPPQKLVTASRSYDDFGSVVFLNRARADRVANASSRYGSNQPGSHGIYERMEFSRRACPGAALHRGWRLHHGWRQQHARQERYGRDVCETA